MKKDKWLKWKAGATITLGIAAMFQMVRTSGQFEAKIASAAASKTDATDTVQQQDPVIDEWDNQRQQSDDGESFRGHRGRHFQRDDSFGDGQSGSIFGDDGSSGSSSSDNGSLFGGSFGGSSGAHSGTGRS